MRVAVIGAGIIGVNAALSLLNRGAEVMLYDRSGPAGGASFGNAGLIATYAVLPEAKPGLAGQVPRMLLDPQGALSIRWRYLPGLLPWLMAFLRAGEPEASVRSADALQSLMAHVTEDYAPVLEQTGASELVRHDGALYIYRSDAALDAAMEEWQEMRRRGVAWRRLGTEELHQLEPALSKGYRAAILLPDVAHVLNPEQLVRWIYQDYLRRGGHFEKEDIAGIVPSDEGMDGGVTLRIGTRRTAPFDHVVLACGAHSAQLCQGLGIRLPLDTERGYNTTISEPSVMPGRPICVAEAGYYMTPMSVGLRIGGKVELGGLKAPPRWSRARRMARHARDVLPGLHVEHGAPWMGFRPSMPDSLPVIGPLSGHPQVIAAFGHGHLGLTLGATTGRMVADMIEGRAPHVDPTPFSPRRFR